MKSIFFACLSALTLSLVSSHALAAETNDQREKSAEYAKSVTKVFGKADVDAFLKAYGKPDIDSSTANDKPRPPVVTRMLTYSAIDLKVFAIADAKLNQPPPYKSWKIVGFTNANSTAAVSADEAKARLTKLSSKGGKK